MRNPPPCPSSLPFAALLAYSPRGSSRTSVGSRTARDVIKRDAPWPGEQQSFIRYSIERLQREVAQGALPGFFGPDEGLVPAPRSAPLTTGALWPGMRICQEMQRVGLGGPILDLLARVTPVRKAAFASLQGLPRPTVAEHLDSLTCTRTLLAPERLLVVDDVVTSGSVLIAAAAHVQATFPSSEVRAFALLRTVSVGEIEQVLAPCAGHITYDGGDYARREP